MLPDAVAAGATGAVIGGLNAPTGAWCSLTGTIDVYYGGALSQCTYRCVVLPDEIEEITWDSFDEVSMHLQVRGAP